MILEMSSFYLIIFLIAILKEKKLFGGSNGKWSTSPKKFKDSTEFWRKISRWWWIVNRLVDLCNGFRAYDYYLLPYGIRIVLGLRIWFMQGIIYAIQGPREREIGWVGDRNSHLMPRELRLIGMDLVFYIYTVMFWRFINWRICFDTNLQL